jgi:hypothetical protein
LESSPKYILKSSENVGAETRKTHFLRHVTKILWDFSIVCLNAPKFYSGVRAVSKIYKIHVSLSCMEKITCTTSNEIRIDTIDTAKINTKHNVPEATSLLIPMTILKIKEKNKEHINEIACSTGIAFTDM